MLDTHHHLWSYNTEEYDWIPAGSPLAQNQLLPELEAATSEAGVTGTVAVQARQITEESDALLTMADQGPLIRGVVGWVPLIDENVGSDLERLSPHEKFVGVRHVLQEEPDEYFLRDDFHRGLSKLPSLGLVYDLLLFQRQIPVSLQLADRQPNLEIVIDHIAKPEAKNGRVEAEWRSGMKKFAERDNIRGVKFSGLVTEFNDDAVIDPDSIRAYFEETLEIFGADRVMFGTDWPVCLLRIDSYREWAETVRSLVGQLSKDEQSQILLTNGETAYHLKS
ncbi:MAG: amidohydrolase family protein [Akkermansiaceae bacterium]